MIDDDNFPLFIEFPELKDILPREKLIQKTPVQKMENLEAKIGAKYIWIKRDDKTTEIYGGNKPRKLEFIYADCLKKGKSKIMTMGGIGSNHCLATAIFCQQFNLKPILVLFHQPVTDDVKKKLLLYRYYGAEIVYNKSEVLSVLSYFTKQRLTRKDTYFLFAGGTTSESTWGHINAACELKEQIEAGDLVEPDLLFVTAGTTGTIAGLEAGLRLLDLKTKIIAVTVVPSITYINALFSCERLVKRIVNEAVKFVKKHVTKMKNFKYNPNFEVNTNYFGGKYGKVTDAGLNAINIVKETENIQLDTTYTGKTFAALLDHVKTHPDDKILFWNTYNSVELPDVEDKVNYKDLPKKLHEIYEK
ncbi:MAG: pyridoxal-phosphate dependent enzyme [Candidatus Lokiarchaeota archaeon]|nr:pyridoxal-phosphate dependent enzyme [Candidatus Lokiarchaeota archaeon]